MKPLNPWRIPIRICFLLLPLLLCCEFATATERNLKLVSTDSKTARVALVIGNGGYRLAPLKNPVNDATDIADTLRTLGFQVTLKLDQDARGIKRAMREFGRALKRSDTVGLFYFAGHGMQVAGRNYLIPVGADVESEHDVEFEGIDAGRLLAEMESAGNPLNIVILDACRNNPFTRSFRSSTRGLAQMDAPSGSIVAYSTAPGAVAADGNGRNSPYTQHLLSAMNTPGLAIEQVFKRTRVGVETGTNGKQTPWESSSLKGDFYFHGGSQMTASPAGTAAVGPAGAVAMELEMWRSVKDSTDEAALDAYLGAYPSGQFVPLAKLRLEMLRRQNQAPSEMAPSLGNGGQTSGAGSLRGHWQGTLADCAQGSQLHLWYGRDLFAVIEGGDIVVWFEHSMLGVSGTVSAHPKPSGNDGFEFSGAMKFNYCEDNCSVAPIGHATFSGRLRGGRIRGEIQMAPGCLGTDFELKRAPPALAAGWVVPN